MLRNVSCCPANDASGRSSAVADERTANDAPGKPAASVAYAVAMSRSRAGGSGAATIQPRISAPARASSATSSTSNDASRAAMRASRSLWARNSRKREGRGGEAAGDADAGPRELADHLAERGILAADALDIGHAQVIERDHPLRFRHPRAPRLWRRILRAAVVGPWCVPRARSAFRRRAALRQPTPETCHFTPAGFGRREHLLRRVIASFRDRGPVGRQRPSGTSAEPARNQRRNEKRRSRRRCLPWIGGASGRVAARRMRGTRHPDVAVEVAVDGGHRHAPRTLLRAARVLAAHRAPQAAVQVGVRIP